MKINRSNIPSKWISNNDVKVSMSTHHSDLYIIDHPNGSFHTINTNAETIVKKYPIKITLMY